MAPGDSLLLIHVYSEATDLKMESAHSLTHTSSFKTPSKRATLTKDNISMDALRERLLSNYKSLGFNLMVR